MQPFAANVRILARLANIRSRCVSLIISAVASQAVVSCVPYHSSAFRICNQFTDGITLSVLTAKKNDSVAFKPVPLGSSGARAVVTEHNRAWVLYWNLAGLSEHQVNYPAKVICLGNSFPDSQPDSFDPGEIRLNSSTGFVIRDTSRGNSDSDRVALYAIGDNRMHLSRSVGKEVPVNALVNVPHTPAPPVFSRSCEYVFFRNPAPSIYSVSNLAQVRTISQGPEFNQLLAKDRVLLTDDQKYLVTTPATFEPGSPEAVDKAYCYDVDANDITLKTIRVATNRTVIIGAESINGRLQFIAFWERSNPASPSMFKHLGVFDENSDLITEIPIELLPDEDRYDFYLWRDCLWDYRHSRIFICRDRRLLTVYDYKNKITRRFPLGISEKGK